MSLLNDFTLIEEAKLLKLDMKLFTKIYKENESAKSVDRLQYALHKCCMKGIKEKSYQEIIINLTQLCYSEPTITQLSNMDRLTGCFYYITKYLIDLEHYEIAVKLSNLFLLKQQCIEDNITDNTTMQDCLYYIHSTYIVAATKLAPCEDKKSMDLCGKLAHSAIKFIQFFKRNDETLGGKIFRNVKYLLNNLSIFSGPWVSELLTDILGVLEHLSKIQYKNSFETLFLSMMSNIAIADQPSDDDLKNIRLKLKNSIYLCSMLSGKDENLKELNIIVDTLITKPDTSNFDDNFKDTLRNVTQCSSAIQKLQCCIIINLGMSIWCKRNICDWMKFISFIRNIAEEVVFPICDELIERRMQPICSKEQHCSEVCASELMSKTLSCLNLLIRLALKNGVDGATDLVDVCLQAFRKCSKCLALMLDNKCSSSARQFSWNCSVIHFFNTVKDLFRVSSATSSYGPLVSCTKQLLHAIFISDLKPPLELQHVFTVFHYLHHGLLEQGQLREALFYSVLYAAHHTDNLEKAMSKWVLTKLRATQDDVKNTHIAAILNEEKSRLEEYLGKSLQPRNKSEHYPWTLQTAHTDPRTMLLVELETYGTQASAELKGAISSAWTALKSLKPSVLEAVSGLCHVISASLPASDPAQLSALRKDCLKLSLLLNKALASNSITTTQHLLYSGKLKFSAFLCFLQLLRDSSTFLEQTDLALDFLKREDEEKLKFGEDLDLNLTCDVAPAQTDLNLDTEGRVLSTLDEAVRLWSCVSSDDAEFLADWEFDELQLGLRQSAFLYDIYGSASRSVSTWIVFLRCAKSRSDVGGQVFGLSQILGRMNPHSCTSKLDELRDLTSQLQLEKNMSKNDKHSLISSLLTQSQVHLRRREEGACLKRLQEAETVIGGVDGNVKYFLNIAKYWCLASQLTIMQPAFQQEFGNKACHAMAYKAFVYINFAAKQSTMTRSEHSETLLTMLHINTWCVHVFNTLQHVLNSRMFLDTLYQLLLRMATPSRVAEVLLHLAEVDVIARKVDDAGLKFDRVREILMLDSVPDLKQRRNEEESSSINLKPAQPQPRINSSPRPLSPIRFLDVAPSLHSSPYRLFPSDADHAPAAPHPPQCPCHPCTDLSVYVLRVAARSVCADIETLRGELRKANVSHETAYRNLKALEQSLEKQRLSVQPDWGSLDLEGPAARWTIANVLLRYFAFQLVPPPSEATPANLDALLEKIRPALEGLDCEAGLLRWTLLELQLCALCILKQKEPEEMESVSLVSQPVGRKVVEAVNTVRTMTAQTPNAQKAQKACHNGLELKGAPRKPATKALLPCRVKGRRVIVEEPPNQPVREKKTVVFQTPMKHHMSPEDTTPVIQENPFVFQDDLPTAVKKGGRRKVTVPTPKTSRKVLEERVVKVYEDAKEEPKQTKKEAQNGGRVYLKTPRPTPKPTEPPSQPVREKKTVVFQTPMKHHMSPEDTTPVIQENPFVFQDNLPTAVKKGGRRKVTVPTPKTSRKVLEERVVKVYEDAKEEPKQTKKEAQNGGRTYLKTPRPTPKPTGENVKSNLKSVRNKIVSDSSEEEAPQTVKKPQARKVDKKMGKRLFVDETASELEVSSDKNNLTYDLFASFEEKLKIDSDDSTISSSPSRRTLRSRKKVK